MRLKVEVCVVLLALAAGASNDCKLAVQDSARKKRELPAHCGERVRRDVGAATSAPWAVFLSAEEPFMAQSPLASCLAPREAAKRHATCAVVGASDNNRGSKFGKAIDSHAAVFRAGAACSAYKPTDCGVKTTYCVSFWRRATRGRRSSAWLARRKQRPGRNETSRTRRSRTIAARHEELTKNLTASSSFPPPPSRSQLVVPLKSWKWVTHRQNLTNTCRKYPELNWRFTHPEWTRSTHGARFAAALEAGLPDVAADFRLHLNHSHFCALDDAPNWKNDHSDSSDCSAPIADFSSGFEALLLALRLCDAPPTLFGFDLDTAANATYKHMLGVERAERERHFVGDHRHPFALERRLMLAWNASGLLRLADMPTPPKSRTRLGFLNLTNINRRWYSHRGKLLTRSGFTPANAANFTQRIQRWKDWQAARRQGGANASDFRATVDRMRNRPRSSSRSSSRRRRAAKQQNQHFFGPPPEEATARHK